jgi:hypothetical protein
MGTCLVSTGYHDKNLFFYNNASHFMLCNPPQAKVFQIYRVLSLGPIISEHPSSRALPYTKIFRGDKH